MKLIYKMVMVIGLLCAITSVKGQSKPGMKENKNSEHVVSVEFNKNIEFLGYVIYMGEPEDDVSEAAKNHPLRQVLEEKRGHLSKEESLLKIFDLAAELPYSLFVELFIRMDELPYKEEFKIPADIMQNYHLNTPADIALTHEIQEQANMFYAVSEFDQFWKSSGFWYAKALEEVNKISLEDELLTVMEGFYEQKFFSYKIIPSLTFWSGPGFGFKEEGEKDTIAYFVLGPLSDDYRFDLEEQFKTKAIHEFGHSFVNHLLEATCQDLIDETRPLFEPVATAMYPQGYNNWWSCIDEHFVRAGEVLIPELMGNATLSEVNLNWNTENKKFIYLPFIVERLRSYRIEEGFSYEQAIRKTMSDLKKKFMP